MRNYQHQRRPNVSWMAIAPWAQVYGDEAASPNQLCEEAVMLAMGASPAVGL
jgi:hypothetical protein